MVARNLGTGNFSIKNNLSYQKKEKLAYPEKNVATWSLAIPLL